jgi:putative membrane protein
MRRDPYSRFEEHELILRDHLAVDRTVLANERTFLAYLRTGLALGAAGGSLIHFVGSALADLAGGCLLASAVVTAAIGMRRYARERRRLGRFDPAREL